MRPASSTGWPDAAAEEFPATTPWWHPARSLESPTLTLPKIERPLQGHALRCPARREPDGRRLAVALKGYWQDWPSACRRRTKLGLVGDGGGLVGGQKSPRVTKHE